MEGCEAAALRAMLIKLDEIEELMNDAAYTEEGEKRIAGLRRQWTDELRKAEYALWSLAGLPEVPRGRR